MRYLCGAVAALLIVPAATLAQGYQVRTWGTYDRFPYPPAVGGTYTFARYSPSVNSVDAWGRPATMPMQPKFLYYDSAIWTPQGWHRPTSIVVIPDDRPKYYSVPSRVVRPASPAPAPSPELSERRPPTIPPAKPPAPLPDRPIPTVPAPKPVRDAKPALPPVPDLPQLTVPSVPGTDDPKLGPAPMRKMD
jgi:hypothetical protein